MSDMDAEALRKRANKTGLWVSGVGGVGLLTSIVMGARAKNEDDLYAWGIVAFCFFGAVTLVGALLTIISREKIKPIGE